MLLLVLLMLWCWIGSYVNSDLVIRIEILSLIFGFLIVNYFYLHFVILFSS